MKNLLFLALYGDNVKISEALLIALIAIIIVFAVLALIIVIIAVMQKLFFSKQKPEVKEETSVKKTSVVKKEIEKKNTEIKDDDMMVAALIATIDYTNETKKDVRLVSIKQIK